MSYPIIEVGSVFKYKMPPFWTVEVLSLWVDEDGVTQVRVLETPDESHDKDRTVRTVTVEDIHDALDQIAGLRVMSDDEG